MIGGRKSMSANCRCTILQALAMEPGTGLDFRPLRDTIERMDGQVISESDVLRELDWLKDRDVITVEWSAPDVLAKLTDHGLALAEGRASIEGVSPPRPDFKSLWIANI